MVKQLITEECILNERSFFFCFTALMTDGCRTYH